MPAPRLEQISLVASAALRGRLFVAVSAGSAPQAAAVVAGLGFSGLIVVGNGCGLSVRTLKSAYGSALLVGKDTEAYQNYTATSTQPMNLHPVLGGAAPTLDACMSDQLSGGADFALTPTGRIKDIATLNAAVDAGNAVRRPGVVLAVPLPARMVAGSSRRDAERGLARSRHPVALIVIGEFDPYKDTGVAEGTRALLQASPQMFLHRTDFAAFESLAHGALGSSIGFTATLRHTVTGRRGSRTRQNPPDRSPIVLLPEIDSFRHRAVFARWFENTQPPICRMAGCCGRNLTLLRDTDADREVANLHNLRAWLPLGERLAAEPRANRRHWLHTYRQQIEQAYVDLRRRTQIRDIRMDDSQRVWLSLGP